MLQRIILILILFAGIRIISYSSENIYSKVQLENVRNTPLLTQMVINKIGEDSLRAGRSRSDKNGTEDVNTINDQNNGTNGNDPNTRWDNQPNNKTGDPIRLDTVKPLDSAGRLHNENILKEKFSYNHYYIIKFFKNLFPDNMSKLIPAAYVKNESLFVRLMTKKYRNI